MKYQATEWGDCHEDVDAANLRQQTALALASPVYNLAPAISGSLDQDPFGKDPEAVAIAIEIIDETLDQATHPDHPLNGSGVLDDLRERAQYFKNQMEEIHQAWQESWGF